MIDAVAIISAAEAQVGIADSDGPTLHRNLERLVAALNDTGGLSAAGEDSVQTGLIARTVDRVRDRFGAKGILPASLTTNENNDQKR